MYFGVYREVTTPAPAIPSQSRPIHPTPNTHFVHQRVLGVGFHVCFGIYGGGGGDLMRVWVGAGRGVLEVVQRVGEGSEGE